MFCSEVSLRLLLSVGISLYSGLSWFIFRFFFLVRGFPEVHLVCNAV